MSAAEDLINPELGLQTELRFNVVVVGQVCNVPLQQQLLRALGLILNINLVYQLAHLRLPLLLVPFQLLET